MKVFPKLAKSENRKTRNASRSQRADRQTRRHPCNTTRVDRRRSSSRAVVRRQVRAPLVERRGTRFSRFSHVHALVTRQRTMCTRIRYVTRSRHRRTAIMYGVIWPCCGCGSSTSTFSLNSLKNPNDRGLDFWRICNNLLYS